MKKPMQQTSSTAATGRVQLAVATAALGLALAAHGLAAGEPATNQGSQDVHVAVDGKERKESLMTEAQTNKLIVINKGRCGQNSGIVRDKFAADVLQVRPKPDVVLIYIGMNDVINDRFFTPLDKYLENMTWLIDQARKEGVTPVICTVHKVNETLVYAHHPRGLFGSETVNEKRMRYNTALRKLAADQKVALADFDEVTAALAESDFLSDGCHLTLAGNKLLANTFLDVIGPQLRGDETIVCVGDSLTYGYQNKGAGSAEGETYPAMLRQASITAATRSLQTAIGTAASGLALAAHGSAADVPAVKQGSADFHVAVIGKDSNPGTAAAPFATLQRAREAVRGKIKKGLNKDILVEVRGGTYRVTEALTFGPEDSGTEKHSITYAAAPGVKVVLSGGRKITGWKKGTNAIWTVEIPEAKGGKWYFRQLFVNGDRAVRARSPNAGDTAPWWNIRASTIKRDTYPVEDAPITLSVSGPVKAYRNLGDVELVYISNNNNARKFLGAVDEQAQTLTFNGPHHWNPKLFGTEWRFSIPIQGLPCYLENAIELLDQPGEWYLERQTGVLSYWPRAGEELATAEVIAPVVPKTVLAVRGTSGRRVVNLHFQGIQVEHVEWVFPSWGYLGLAVCTRTTDKGNDQNPGWEFVDAAVEYEHAAACSFKAGRIAHVGSIGLCLRPSTADIVVEGNEICDTGGNGISAGYAENCAYGYVHAPGPAPDDATGILIANNHIHHCGVTDYAGCGVLLAESKNSTVAHNLIHDVGYFGIGFAGSQDPKIRFATNNAIEYNHIYRAMQVTFDGAGLYTTFTQYGALCSIRGNLVHDIRNPFSKVRYASCGVYLDGKNSNCRYENNVVFGATTALNISDQGRRDNLWIDNIFQQNGTPPAAFVEAVAGVAGLEPAYRRALQGTNDSVYDCSFLVDRGSECTAWGAYQYNRSSTREGVLHVVRRAKSIDTSRRLKLRELDPAASYDLKVWAAVFDPRDGMLVTDTRPLAEVAKVLSDGKTRMTGRQLMEDGLAVQLDSQSQAVWVAYQRVK